MLTGSLQITNMAQDIADTKSPFEMAVDYGNSVVSCWKY